MKKILVTGANGQLGKELRDIAANFPQFEFLSFLFDSKNTEEVKIQKS